MRKTFVFIAALALTVLVVVAPWCRMPSAAMTPVSRAPVDALIIMPDNPTAPAAPATIERVLPQTSRATRPPIRTAADSATLTPPTLTATLRPGQCITETKTLFLPADVRPAKLDLVICMDLTGSMGGELNNVKLNSANIATQVRALIADSDFGLMSHMDYPGNHSGCGYGSTYGSFPPDYAYQLDLPVTSNVPALTAAINGLSLGNGADFPEDYSRPFYESYADPGVGWRPGAKRILMAWLDAIPHDCKYDSILGGSSSTGPDPGRDAIDNNADDLRILSVLDAMAANNITLIPLQSGGFQTLWQAYAQKTPGGDAFVINSNGTIPGGTNIADFIAALVESTTAHVDTLRLEACDPAYRGWLRSTSPSYYTDITLDHDQSFNFNVEICVPPDARDGTYCFDICARGDGADFAQQHVCITVVTNHPPDCSGATPSVAELWPPNHQFVDVTINGVTDPDGDSVAVTIIGVTQDEPTNTVGDGNTCPDASFSGATASVRSERTGTPRVPGNGRVYRIAFEASDGRGGTCRDSVYVCVPHDQRPGHVCVDDGQDYNSLSCRTASPVAARIEGPQAVGIRSARVSGNDAVIEYRLPAELDVQLEVFDVLGRKIATLENARRIAGEHSVTWNTAGVRGGVYYARLQAGSVTVTKSVLVLK